MAGSLLGEPVSSILVFKQRNIGDVLLATPAIHALRSAWPKARLAVAVNSGTEAMVTGNPDVDRVLVFDRSAREAGGIRRMREELRFLAEIRAWMPDLAVQLTEGDRGAILAFLSGARFRAGVAPGRGGLAGKERLFTHLCPRPPLLRSAALRDLDVVAAAGIPPADLRLRFSLAEDDRLRVSGAPLRGRDSRRRTVRGRAARIAVEIQMLDRWGKRGSPCPSRPAGSLSR